MSKALPTELSEELLEIWDKYEKLRNDHDTLRKKLLDVTQQMVAIENEKTAQDLAEP